MLISVLCTSYNKSKWIEQAIESVLSQEVSCPFEIIVVDDASTDGSQDIIQRLQSQHPDIIRAFMQQENKGISQTWFEACSYVKGDYIARLDADDYWTSPHKLQKQLDMLQNNPDSKWCCTDFDMVDANGQVQVHNAVASGVIPAIDTFEEMLATKGLTMSSSWLVETNLMLQANKRLRADDADDTFSLQLEMFGETKLTRVPESLSAMRVNWGSDSRPMTEEEAKTRFEGLRNQQLAYIQKNPQADYKATACYLIEQDMKKDMEIFKRDRRIGDLIGQIEQLNQELAAAKQAAHEAAQGGALKKAARSLAHRARKN